MFHMVLPKRTRRDVGTEIVAVANLEEAVFANGAGSRDYNE